MLERVRGGADRLETIRGFNLSLFAIGFIGLIGCVQALGFSRLAGLTVLLIYSLSPGNIHDAHMARPETFLATLIILYLFFCILYLKNKIYLLALVAAFVLGFAAATKFTLAILMVLVIAFVFMRESANFNLNLTRYILGVLTFVLLGFSLGAPYAIADLKGYIDGVNQLRYQYSNLHLPHSHTNGGGTWFWQLEFFLKIYGFIVVLPFILIFISLKNKNYTVELYFAVCALLFVFIFGRASVFFERNINPIIPLYALLVGFFINRFNFKLKITLVGVVVAPLLYWSYLMHSVQLEKYSFQANEIENALVEKYKPNKIVHKAMFVDVSGCGVIRFMDYSDDTSKESRANLIANDWKGLMEFKGPFHWLPTSTLHTYLSGNIFWYFKDCSNEK